VKIERDMDVALAASLAGMSEEHFRQFNPQMNQPVILAKAGGEAGGQVLLPYDNAAVFIGQLASYQASHQGPLASWTAWVVPKTMKSAEAAKLVGMSEAQLREVNKIPARMLVKQGSTLLVPRTAHRDQDISEHLAENASMSLAPDVPPLRRVALKAGKGETVASLAKRYRLSATQVAQWNKVNVKATFKPGQTLVVYTAQAAEPAPNAAPVRVAKADSKADRGGAKSSQRAGKASLGTGGRTVTAMNASAPVLARQLTQRR
jgi:membrane-bound lytic murein transglycosylase D